MAMQGEWGQSQQGALFVQTDLWALGTGCPVCADRSEGHWVRPGHRPSSKEQKGQ